MKYYEYLVYSPSSDLNFAEASPRVEPHRDTGVYPRQGVYDLRRQPSKFVLNRHIAPYRNPETDFAKQPRRG